MKLTTEQRKRIKPLVAAAYPNYKGRKISVSVSSRPLDMWSMWEEGSRDTFVAICLADLSIKPVPGTSVTNPRANRAVVVPPGYAVLEHTMFCGKDCGIRIHLNPANWQEPLQIERAGGLTT